MGHNLRHDDANLQMGPNQRWAAEKEADRDREQQSEFDQQQRQRELEDAQDRFVAWGLVEYMQVLSKILVESLTGFLTDGFTFSF